MTFTEAAAEVLRLTGKPMHYKEITEVAIEKNLLSHVGKSPEVTMGARLAALLKKDDKGNPIVRVKPGVFALREWDEKKGRRGSREKVEREEPVSAPEVEATEIDALVVEAATREASAEAAEAAEAPALEAPVAETRTRPAAGSTGRLSSPAFAEGDEGDEEIAVTGEDALRADLAASGAELFDDEDDDDQPILGGPSAAPGVPGEAGAEGGRRRRRRRRRGRGGAQTEFGLADRPGGRDAGSQPRLEAGADRGRGAADAGARSRSADADAGRGADTGEGRPIQPMPILSIDGDTVAESLRDPLAPAPRPMVRERQQIMAGGSPTGIEVPLGEGDELAGKELADAAALVLGSFDRNAGPVAVRTLVDALMRRGRLSGDPATASVQLSASMRADNLRRAIAAQRPRFRFANGGRVALTDWALGNDLSRLEQEVIAAVERYREGARRVLLRRIQELPGHAFIELALVALERNGMTNVRPVRRAGSPGGEAHFAATHRSGGDEIRTALVIRKDGREVGRERVTDLRGALHHYGPASSGWLVTTGQVLSGAREEAAAPGAAPIALYDGFGFCRLLEDSDVAVVRTRFPIAIPDLELLETLRS